MNPLIGAMGLALLVAAAHAPPALAADPDPVWMPGGISLATPYQGFVGPEACAGCHAEQVTAQHGDPHFLASLPATAKTIFGSFEPGRNRLPTRDAEKDLLMWSDDSGFHQSLVLRGGTRDVRLRSGKFAIVIGTVKGQTYLYWRDEVLAQ